jgi:hypothetical protein
VAALLEHPARPRRVGSGLDGYTQRPFGGEAPPEGLGGGTQPTLLHNLAAYCVDDLRRSAVVHNLHVIARMPEEQRDAVAA